MIKETNFNNLSNVPWAWRRNIQIREVSNIWGMGVRMRKQEISE
jgi:hypothetical protein